MKKMLFIAIFMLLCADLSFGRDYKRIISLAPSITKSLYELNLDSQLIGITIFCPKGKANKEIVGTLIEPDIEKIISLKPDLIIATKEGNSKGMIEKLKNMGFNVYIMEAVYNFEDICDNFLALAKEVDRQVIAQQSINQAKTKVKAVLDRSKRQKAQTIFWEIGTNPLYTAGGQSFLNDYNRYSNTKNIYEYINVRYSPISIEAVVIRDPDIIISFNMDDNSDVVKRWSIYKGMKAVKNNRVYILKADDLFAFTPISFAQGLEKIAQIMAF